MVELITKCDDSVTLKLSRYEMTLLNDALENLATDAGNGDYSEQWPDWVEEYGEQNLATRIDDSETLQAQLNQMWA